MKKNVLSALLVLTLIPAASFANPVNVQKEIVEDTKIVAPEMQQRDLSEVEEVFILKGKVALEAFLNADLSKVYTKDYIRDVYIPEENPEFKDENVYVNFYPVNPESDFYSISFNQKTGKIISLSSYVYYQDGIKPVYSNEDAREIATSFVKSLKPGKEFAADYFEEDQQTPYFNIGFAMKEGNIKTDFNYVSVTVDKITGKINSFYLPEVNENLKYQAMDKIISKEKVKENAIKNSKANLKYFYDFEKKIAIPVYEIDLNGTDFVGAKDLKPLYNDRIKEISKDNLKSSGLIDFKNIDEIVSFLEKELSLDLIEIEKYDYDEIQSRYYKVEDNENIFVSVEMEKGKLKSFNYYDSSKDYDIPVKNPISYEKAFDISLGYLEKLVGDKVRELDTTNYEYLGEDGYISNSHAFYFARTLDSIAFPDNGVQIEINLETGKINSFYINWEKDVQFEKLRKEIIGRTKAIENFFESIDFELIYSISGNTKENPLDVNLFYGLDYSNYKSNMINANTGEIVENVYRVYENEKEISNTLIEKGVMSNEKSN